MGTARDEAVRQAFVAACLLDVQARKPGNVSFASSGHRMQAELFVASAQAAVEPLCAPGATVGERIEGAVRATLDVVHCNTNLGILLLCAPLAAAAQSASAPTDTTTLRHALDDVLTRLGVGDAHAAFRAIAAANPGGLGSADAQDVAHTPTVGLRDAMALAADRDRIALQYLSGFVDVFELGLPTWAAASAGSASDAMQRVFLEFLAAHADSHIVRKHGQALAQCVMTEAQPWRASARAGTLSNDLRGFAAWDESLKLRSINPGTTADLCVATAFAAALLDKRP
jgi:triphosphoribosyl-dephospho-CoA synthase